jgi:uncharacterized membrane protein YbaN (DUF454 family)
MSFKTPFHDVTVESASTTAFDGPDGGLTTIVPVSILPHEPGGGTPNARSGPSRAADGPSIGCCETAGVVEIHDPRLLRHGREAFCRALVETAVARCGANRAEVCLGSSTCRMEFGPGRFDRSELASRTAAAVRMATQAVHNAPEHQDVIRARWGVLSASATPDGAVRSARTNQIADGRPTYLPLQEILQDSRRLSHLAMAGGSFVLAIGGLILPGVPTLPFLIMTGRHAIHASPRIERLLRRQSWCNVLFVEANASTRAALDWRSLSRMVGLGLLLAAGFWILHPPLPVVLGVEIGLMAFLAWRDFGRTSPSVPDPGAFA